jgi:CheY-like chemotaxis protein
MSELEKGPILVVEDMPQIRGLLEVTLRFEGFPVESASDGVEALEKIKVIKPALVITDILMPKMDGFSLIFNIRKDPETRNVPVIFLSATYVTKEDKDFALSLGALRFLEKPVDTAEFLLTIGEIMAAGVPQPPPAIDEKEFYKGYRRRLENKLRQKNQQIVRTEQLLENLSEPQKPAFESLLKESRVHRDEIVKELEEVIQTIKKFEQE